MTLNIYQAALRLRQDYAHTGIELEASECAVTNLYFIFHDSLHTYLGCPPEFEYEPIVLATEMLLGGKDFSHMNVDIDEVTTRLGSIDAEIVEILISFYTNYFN